MIHIRNSQQLNLKLKLIIKRSQRYEKPKTRDQLKIEKLVSCRRLIRENLKDPSSFKVLNSSYSQKETGIIKYSATNSFGARVQESFKCFNPQVL